MSFFEDLPPVPEPPEEEETDYEMPPWLGPPQQVMGAVVAMAQVLVRTEHVFVGLRSMSLSQ